MSKKPDTFKYFIEQEELKISAPIVRQLSDAKHMLDHALTYIDLAKNYLLKLCSSSIFKESGDDFAMYVVYKIIENEEFIRFVDENYGIRPLFTTAGYDYKCGTESCAFFYTNNTVLKFLDGAKAELEFKIANAIKGELSMFPVKDAVEIEIYEDDETVFMVVMETLDEVTDSSTKVTLAANYLARYVNKLQEMIESKPWISTDNIKKRLSMYNITSEFGHLDDETKHYVQDLIKVIRLVYDRTGIIFGADLMMGKNVGMSKSARKIMVYDYGRATAHRPVDAESDKKPVNLPIR